MILGSAQFGLDYGITNTTGQVHTKHIREILQLAQTGGIHTIDTAFAYGNSEEVLGEVGVDDFAIITKTSPLSEGVDLVLQNLHNSFIKLKRDNVYGVLIHNITEIYHQDFDLLYSALQTLKHHKQIKKIGFSTYTPCQVDYVLEHFDFDIIQVPCNVFDTRLIQEGQLKKLKAHNVEIHARSIFLQGILLNFQNLPKFFDRWNNQFQQYNTMVAEHNMSLLEYALNYALAIDEIDKVVIGVESSRQLQQILNSVHTNPVMLDSYSIIDNNLLNPSNWNI